jgi:hypothetical protein
MDGTVERQIIGMLENDERRQDEPDEIEIVGMVEESRDSLSNLVTYAPP